MFIWDASAPKEALTGGSMGGGGGVAGVYLRGACPAPQQPQTLRVCILIMRIEKSACVCVCVCVTENPLPWASQHSPMK